MDIRKEKKDRMYVLLRKDAPISYVLRSKGTRHNPLLYNQDGINRPLRYSPNQKSPFEDEQDGNIVLSPIVFEDGMLFVPSSNLILQEFLSLTPDAGRVFVELDKEKEAKASLERINDEVDALIAAKSMELSMMETVARVALSVDVEKVTTAELKRDVLVFARNHPKAFLDILKDPLLRVQDTVARCFEEQILKMRNKNRDVYFNLPNNKSKLMTIPFGENKIFIVSEYLQSDEGIETLKMLEKNLSTIS